MQERARATYALRTVFGIGLWFALFFTVPGLNFALPGYLLTLALILYGLAALGVLWIICQKWPGFLGLPVDLSPFAVLGRLLLLWPLSGLVLVIPFGLAGYLETALLWENAADNPQADLYVVLGAAWNALWWAFLPAVLLARKWADPGREQ